MKGWFKVSFLVLMLFAGVQQSFADQTHSPVGEWKTIDDVTHQPKAIVQITEDATHHLSGRILQFYPDPTHDEHERCEACTGARHHQPILGMVILDGVKQQDTDFWGGGEILDPKNGKVYRVTLQLRDNDQKLLVHGYIGIPLLGRTQTWWRLK